jgi:beta-lactamase class A
MSCHRRSLLIFAVSGFGIQRKAVAQHGAGDARVAVAEAVQRFAASIEAASCLIDAAVPSGAWTEGHDPDRPLFVGSAVKTFILAEYLRGIEAGRLSLDQQVAIDDQVRSLSSPVFLNLTGRTEARAVLEAMIAHSDNTATDAVLADIGAERVRALIKDAGLARTKIPESTRRLFSYLAGAPPGVDVGWEA